MHRGPTIILGALLLWAPSRLLAAGPLDDSERGPGQATKCVEVRTQTPYRGYGYDHVVEIDNHCEKPASCTVKTDVNPEVQTVTVPAHETRSVTTFRGSPAREFKADVQCTLQ